jgi:hypothetical protein
MALSNKDVSIVKGMLARGDDQHDIAAWFSENGGRIAEISTGAVGASIVAAPTKDLPPKGPIGRKAKRLRAYSSDALAKLKSGGPAAVADAIAELEAGLASFEKHES